MNPSRRGFLKGLLTAPAAIALAPSLLKETAVEPSPLVIGSTVEIESAWDGPWPTEEIIAKMRDEIMLETVRNSAAYQEYLARKVMDESGYSMMVSSRTEVRPDGRTINLPVVESLLPNTNVIDELIDPHILDLLG